MQKYNSFSKAEKSYREVYAVSAGASVTFSSSFAYGCSNYFLDSDSQAGSWIAKQKKVGEWIQVYQQSPKLWTGIIIQGRKLNNQYVKSIKVGYTVNGKEWELLNNGQVFQANCDNTTKVRINFNQPVLARTLRIYPQTWNDYISMRFDAIFIDLE